MRTQPRIAKHGRRSSKRSSRKPDADGTERCELRDDPIAGLDVDRARAATRQDDVSGFEDRPETVELVDQPRHRRGGVAQNSRAGARLKNDFMYKNNN